MDTTTAVLLLIAANVVVMYLIKRRRDRLKHHLPMARLYHGSYLLIIVVLLGLIATRGNDASTQYQSALIAKTQNYRNIEWLGKPIWQPVLDLWTLQETIYEVGPELLIECGTFRGGSSYFFAQLFDLMDHGRVITVDILKQHDLSHPRVTYLIGDCASDEIVSRIHREAEGVTGPIMVVLDSDHSAPHVLNEMQAYHGLVTPGSYLHVQDGSIDVLPEFSGARPGPLVAIETFLTGPPSSNWIKSAQIASS